MASSVFFKFKSQKEPTRVEFDGTGISVFELKRDIISKSGLGDGTDFDLFIYTDDNTEEYDDDTTIIPRSTTVIARRQPAARPGAGRAARYVSGKMPVSAKNAGRKEQGSKATSSKPSSNAINQMSNAMTEEEKMAAMFAAQTEQWSAQQDEMSHQTPIFKPGFKRPANVPDHEPPNGYICYRCGQKGHWIQLCPTNDDPDFDNRPRVKRTTGIPRSFLHKVDKSVIMSEGDDSKRPSGIMVNAEGDFVIAEPDKASWEQFQAKTKSTNSGKAPHEEDKDIEERGLKCSIDKKMFIEPMKTPCCEKTFCNDCITNALIESDFVCPACQTESVLIDDLTPDQEASKKIQEYLKEKEAVKSPSPAPAVAEPSAEEKAQEVEDATAKPEKKPAEEENANEENPKPSADTSNKSPTDTKSPITSAKSPPALSVANPVTTSTKEAQQPTADNAFSKKRPAEEPLENNPKIPKGPKAMQNKLNQNGMPNMMNGVPGMDMSMMMNGMPMMPGMMGMPMPPMNMGDMGNMGNMGNMMGLPPMMNMPMNMMGGFPNMNNGYGGMNMWNNNAMNGMNGNNMNRNMSGNSNGNFQNGGNFGPTQGMGGMQGPAHGGAGGEGDDDGAYFRKPVNPHRHLNKQKRVRPSDYREL